MVSLMAADQAMIDVMFNRASPIDGSATRHHIRKVVIILMSFVCNLESMAIRTTELPSLSSLYYTLYSALITFFSV